jgi:hypothetical protein
MTERDVTERWTVHEAWVWRNKQCNYLLLGKWYAAGHTTLVHDVHTARLNLAWTEWTHQCDQHTAIAAPHRQINELFLTWKVNKSSVFSRRTCICTVQPAAVGSGRLALAFQTHFRSQGFRRGYETSFTKSRGKLHAQMGAYGRRGLQRASAGGKIRQQYRHFI